MSDWLSYAVDLSCEDQHTQGQTVDGVKLCTECGGVIAPANDGALRRKTLKLLNKSRNDAWLETDEEDIDIP